ncbi:MAG: T9SS type A sorting domain-containing protein [Saprospiraceae bacterium]
MKIRLLTFLFAFVAPMLVFGQTFSNNTGGNLPASGTSGVATSDVTVAGVAGSTLTGGTCPAGSIMPDLDVPATLGYNTMISQVKLLNVQHTFAADLDIRLIAPDGTVLNVNLDNGGSTGLDTASDMCFDPTATDCADVWTSSTSNAQPANCLLPEIMENTCGPLTVDFEFACVVPSRISAPAIDGTWTLEITDDAGGDSGSFSGWEITFAAMPPPAMTSAGVVVDLLSCCVDMCELTGPGDLNIPLGAGECSAIALYEAPGITGGASCVFCETPALPTFAITAQVNATVEETIGDDGLPTEVVLSEGGTAEYTITAVEAGTLTFDYDHNGSTFWDPFEISGPNGVIVNNTPTEGTIQESIAAGESIVASVNSSDAFTDGSSLTLTGFSFLGADYPCFKLELLDGPAQGTYLDAGSYGANYQATKYDLVGGEEVASTDPDDIITFTQNINVLEYSGPVTTALACNDHINISVDEDCTITFNADMFLEGGPYNCYDDYEVNIWLYGVESNQTGNVNTQTMPFGALLGTHTYEVIDPETGNRCWGTFTAEDKLAPMLDCNDYTITCTENPINSPVVVDLSMVTILEATSNTGDNTYSVNIPSNFNITDLNVLVDLVITGSQFAWGATLTSPSGAEISLWPNGIGGCGTGINFIADDQGPAGITCAQFQNGGPSSTLTLFTQFGFPYTPLSAVNGTSAQGTWTLNLGGDVDVNEFTLIFNGGSGLLVAGTPDADACGSTSYEYSDDVADNGCAGSVITRTWMATDASGSSSEACTQTITVENIGLAGITLPEALVVLNCGVGTTPADIQAYFDNPLTKNIALSANCKLDVVENNEGTPFAYPHYFQKGCDNGSHPQAVDNNVCDVYATYSDQEIPACGNECNGNVKVIRTWTLLDWCTNETVDFTQLIKAVDSTDPTFAVTDETFSTDPWGCAANIDIPQPSELHDNCTDDITYTVSGPIGVFIVGDATSGYTAMNVPKGEHTFTYTASDCCGNTTSHDATFTVFDGAAPVAVAIQNIVISLTSSASSNDGFAKLFASSVDNGSHDGCTGVKIEIRREDDICNVKGNDTYNADGHLDDGSPSPSSPSYDPDGGAYVKFCCADITNASVDVDGDDINDAGYVQVWMRVWDDADMNGAYGTDGDNYNETWTFVKVEDKLAPTISCPPNITITCDNDYLDTSVTGVANGFASCGSIDVEYKDIIVNLSTCNVGFVKRRWNIVGKPLIICDQEIVIEDLSGPDPSVSFNAVSDFSAVGCPDMISVGEPAWVAGPCDVIGYSVETDTFLFEDGACYKLVRHYTVINWCTYNPNSPLWQETPDFSDGIVRHTQVIKVTDETVPVILDCAPQMYAVNDHADSDNDGNVCEANIILTNTATDAGSANCPTAWLKWTVKVDLWGDGTYDLEFSSHLPEFDSQFNDTNGNGIPDVYLEPTESGQEVSIPLGEIGGSMSNHKVYWQVTDGCQNNASCNSTFMVVDKKAPTPYCVSLSTAVMEMGENNVAGVNLWAVDFNIGSFDNCTEQENLRYTFTDVAPENDPLYDEASRSSSRLFDCTDVVNSPVSVSMYVWDEKGNSDFCSVFLTIVDNQGHCPTGSKADVAGTIETAVGDAVTDVEVTVNAALTEYPRTDMTNQAGEYAFADAPTGISYEISANKDVDYLNGVSTLDLVKIQRHILEIELLDSPYKVIAADINADDAVKASDLSILRKLILGVITELPTNDSWRFVDATQSLTMDFDLADVREVADVINLQNDMMHNDLVAVKIGDVTDNAVANLSSVSSEVRSNKTVTFTIADKQVVAGETVEVEFASEDFANVYGYQFTMELNGLTFASVQGAAVNMNDANVGVISNNVVTVSYNNSEAKSVGNNEAIFVMTFTATQNGNLGNMINATSKVTTAEAYVGQSLEVRNVAIATRGDVVEVETSELFQNEPNPFKGQTVITFNLAEAGTATFTVLDVTGKVVLVRNIEGTRGHNTVKLTANELGTSGVLYYQLESGDFTATKKMIIID